MKSCKLLVWLAGTAWLSGCATVYEGLQAKTAALPEASRAYVMGAYSVDCRAGTGGCVQAFNEISAEYRSQVDPLLRGTLASVWGNVIKGDTVHDEVDAAAGTRTFFFCVPLAPGPYEFHALSYYNYAGGGTGYSMRPEQFFSVPFVLQPGELVNVGRLHVASTRGKNVFGMTLSGPGALYLAPGSPTTRQAALRKCPAVVQDRPTRDATLRVKPGDTSPFVVEAR